MAGPHRWIKNTPSAWEAGSFDTGLLPASSEIVRFDGSAQGPVVGGLNQAAVDLDVLDIHEAYLANIGGHGNPLIISANTVLHQGGGTLFYSDGNGTTDLMIVESHNATEAVYISGGTITRLRVNKGRVIFLQGITGITTLEVSYVDSPATDAIVEAAFEAGGIVGKLHMDAGHAIGPLVKSIGGNGARINGGLWETSSLGTGELVLAGGNVIWDSIFLPAGVSLLFSSDAHIISGVLDARPGGPKTMSGTVYIWPAGTFLYNEDTMSHTEARIKP